MMTAARASSDTIQARHPDPYLTIRAKFFDDSILGIVRKSSIQQAVILAAGMDARGLRLDWPDGLVLFEVDRDEVFEHKGSRSDPVARETHVRQAHRPCGTSLTKWTEALVKTGFDSNRPSAFLIEGLLVYLDEPAVAKLLQTSGLSRARAAGWASISSAGPASHRPGRQPLCDNLKKLGCPWTFGVGDPEVFLADHGWRGTIVAGRRACGELRPLAVSGCAPPCPGPAPDLSHLCTAKSLFRLMMIQCGHFCWSM